jgi:hypothetical protein
MLASPSLSTLPPGPGHANLGRSDWAGLVGRLDPLKQGFKYTILSNQARFHPQLLPIFQLWPDAHS